MVNYGQSILNKQQKAFLFSVPFLLLLSSFYMLTMLTIDDQLIKSVGYSVPDCDHPMANFIV